ncbi:hypothetical protein BGX23_009054 [Mortierella sp. AD031]|nr:hypothetical protein BGX23_009054 [Mortierella sp. AD031]
MDPSSTPRTNSRRGLRRPEYGLLQPRESKRLATAQYSGATWTTNNTITTESHAGSDFSHGQQSLAEDHTGTGSDDNPFQTTDISDMSLPTPRGNFTRTGLRRPDYGPMQSHVFKRYPPTPHVVKRRTVVDESLLEAMIQTHIRAPENTSDEVEGHGVNEASHIQQTISELPSELPGPPTWDDDPFAGVYYSDQVNPPQTPKRESRSFTTAPGSGRRTPRRRSRSSNQHLRTTPIKALADANEARVNRLISEANKRGRVGRDKHSPMGILRQLSRVPGFNPPPKPSPDREPIPGSSNWRKLTPRSTRTKHIDISGDIDNPFTTTPRDRESLRQLGSGSRSTERAALSSAERRAKDRFRDDNPFLEPEDFNRLWEEELDVARNQLAKGRGSFGMPLSGGVDELLLGDNDTRDLTFASHLTDPFLSHAELGDRPQHVDDITIHSVGGFDEGHEQDLEQGQKQGTANQLGSAQEGAAAREGYSEYTMEVPSGVTQGGVMGADDAHAAEEGDPDQDKDMDLDNDGWEDIPDDELTQDFLKQQGNQSDKDMNPDAVAGYEDIQADSKEGPDPSEVTGEDQDVAAIDGDVYNSETMERDDQDLTVMDNEDQDMAGLNDDDQGTALEPVDERDQDTAGVDGQGQGQDQDINLADDQDQADVNEDGQDLEAQNEHEFDDGYMNVNDEDHVEQQEHEEQQGRSGVQYYDDFPSELGIMSNGNILPTSLPKTKKAVRRSRAGIPVPSMPTSLQKQLIHTFSRARMSQEAMNVILDGSHLFFEQAANDLAAYADHAGRKTIDESDVECLMKRLRILHDKVSLESLLQRYLPRELRDKVLFPEDMPNSRRI